MTKNRFRNLCKECGVVVEGYSGNTKTFFISGAEETITILSQYVDHQWPFDIAIDR